MDQLKHFRYINQQFYLLSLPQAQTYQAGMLGRIRKTEKNKT